MVAQRGETGVHLGGKKRDFAWRLDAPERAAQAGLRTVNIGALLGLGEPRSEMFRTGLHARYLEDRYLQSEVAVSFPRINAAEGDFTAVHAVDDRLFVQMITALRIFLPRAGITLSTRERAVLRDRLLPLGVTRLSAGVSTRVGGYASPKSESDGATVIVKRATQDTPQFEITDTRSVAEVTADGATSAFRTVPCTVAEALRAFGVSLRGDDFTEPALTERVTGPALDTRRAEYALQTATGGTRLPQQLWLDADVTVITATDSWPRANTWLASHRLTPRPTTSTTKAQAHASDHAPYRKGKSSWGK